MTDLQQIVAGNEVVVLVIVYDQFKEILHTIPKVIILYYTQAYDAMLLLFIHTGVALFKTRFQSFKSKLPFFP